MLHQKNTQNFYRDIEGDLQYLANVQNSDTADAEIYRVLAEYDEMERANLPEDR